MSLELLAAFVLFAVVTLFTPGPNNVMLMASGLNFGLPRTLPHVLGVSLGFAMMAALVGLGLGAMFTAYPVLHTILKYAGAAYLLYFAWLIAHAAPADPEGDGHRRPLTFLEAAAVPVDQPERLGHGDRRQRQLRRARGLSGEHRHHGGPVRLAGNPVRAGLGLVR